MNSLESLGWNDFYRGQVGDRNGAPLRVTADHGAILMAEGAVGVVVVDPYGAETRPVVGDWVLARDGGPDGRYLVRAVLERRSVLSRHLAGPRTGEQIIAANVDVVFIVMGLDRDYSVRRLERYLAAAWESGATPVVLLTKPDLVDDVAVRLAEVATVAPVVPVHVVSPLTGEGVEAVSSHLGHGVTGVLVGSSGVGKSTLVNRLRGDAALPTGAVRADGRGRHVTTVRRLTRLAGGGMLVDVPGMRELQLWDAEDGMGMVFADIEALAAACRFRDCSHDGEPGCAVEAAVRSGELPGDRLESFRTLAREAASQERRRDVFARRKERRRWAEIQRSMRVHHRNRR